MRKKFKCKIFSERLLDIPLEEQVNNFFEEHEDIDIETILQNIDSILIIYKEKNN